MTRKEAIALYDELHDLCGADLTPTVRTQAEAVTSRFFRDSPNARSVAGEARKVIWGMGGGVVWNRLESLRQAIDECWPEEKAD